MSVNIQFDLQMYPYLLNQRNHAVEIDEDVCVWVCMKTEARIDVVYV